MKRYITLREAFGAAALLAAGCAHAQEKVKIGLLTDLSGVYADVDGNGSATAIRMAIEDFGGKALGQPIELVTGDHQNKPDLASTKTREWLDITGVTMVIGGGSSAATLAMTQIAREKKRVMFAGSSGAVAITNEACTPYTIAYSWDTRAYSRGTAKAVVDAGGKSWYFLTVDYAAGHAFEADAGATVKASGGTVVGSSRHPINAPDFSSQLVTTQASNAQVLGLANAGGDTINAIKSAREFGLTQKMKMAR